MADLRSRFIEDYAGGILNVSRQELSTVGEVLSQDGLPSQGTIFIEDGSGVKSGLKVGVSLAEAVDPTTDMGVVNVRFADRTYAKIRDLKIFSTAIASAQAALSEATSTSISNLETAFELLEADLTTLTQSIQDIVDRQQSTIEDFTSSQGGEVGSISSRIEAAESDIEELVDRIEAQTSRVTNLETVIEDLGRLVSQEVQVGKVSEDVNQVYYSGTIECSNGIVTGVDTDFSNELEVGTVFIAEGTDSLSQAGEVEFTVLAFDTSAPNTKMYVQPTDVTVTAGSRYKVDKLLTISKQFNNLISKLQNLKILA